MTIYYAGQPGDGYGWGVCNRNLIRELGKLCEVSTPAGGARYLDGAVFMPLADHDFNQAEPDCPVHAFSKKLAYTFFEFPLGPNAATNAAQYDVVFCGSTWCKDRMEEAGITNAEVLVQGVDHELFHPQEPRKPDGKLRIFSGGKFEYRKGQDIVLAAVDILASRYDVELVASWFNPWPATTESMKQTHYLPQETVQALQRVVISGREHSGPNVQFLAPMVNAEIAQHMHGTDVGIFPNRCEGGTNLVLMEYLATGKPVVVSNGTGHLDVIGVNCVPVDGTTDDQHWCNVTPAAVAAAVDKARGMTLLPPSKRWSWERAAKQIMERINA